MNRTYEEELDLHGSFTFTNVGTSMMPLLRQHKDLFVIEKKTDERCKKYDAVLFKRANGQYVLHRILKVRENNYVLCGDHQFQSEYGITDDQILGVMTKVIRDGVIISVTDKKYWWYVHLWCDFFYVRAAVLWMKMYLYRVQRKFEKMIAK
ncbi:MAG: hypothetical protein ACERKN_18750 [Velocimicrobium sp.]